MQASIELKAPKNIEKKGIERLIKDFALLCDEEKNRINEVLNNKIIEKEIKKLKKKYDKVFKENKDNVWSNQFSGKYIFNRFCGEVFKEKPIKVREAYIEEIIRQREAGEKTIMDPIFKIFENFKKTAT